MARTNEKGFFYLHCIKCKKFRRDVKDDVNFKNTKVLLAIFNVKSVEDLKQVYVCRDCRKDNPKTIKKQPVSAQDTSLNTQNNGSDLAYLIPANNVKYIERGIQDSTDIDILTESFNHNTKNYNNPEAKLKNIMIVGECGTGKSHLARYFAHKMKLPYKRINLNGATTVEDLVGQVIPTADKGFRWVDGWLTKFMRNGGILVLDEINMAQADILALLNPVLDDERTLTLTQKDGEMIKAHKNFFVICTMNMGYEGTKPLNEALKDRFSDILVFDYDDKIENKLVKNKNILVFAEKLRYAYNNGEIITPVSTRSLMFFDNNISIYGEKVAKELFFNRFDKSEKKIIDELWKTLFTTNKEVGQENANQA